MSSGEAKFVFVTALIINCILLAQTRYGEPYESQFARSQNLQMLKRSVFSDGIYTNITSTENCRPLDYTHVTDQCTHVWKDCPASTTALSIPYLQMYFCADAATRPLIFTALLFWLFFLFSTLGISASDFFTPNLATIAQLLGLDENVAGVTFLAFGNGSPDVFSTFSAMRANSGSLAIGELLGAASFIVSCVVGSMCIIKPFRVDKVPFIRDVGFFTAAVGLLLVILWDGQIHSWEAGALVVLYIIYALVVIVGSWWERRQERKRRIEALIRAEYGDDDDATLPSFHDEDPYRDELGRARAISHPGPMRLGLQTDLPPRPHSRTPSPPPATPHITQMPSFSLVGALEFRQVVASLQNQASSSSLSIFDSPITPYAGGHYHRRRRSGSHTPTREIDPWDAALGVPLNDRSPRLMVNSVLAEDVDDTNRERNLEDGTPTPMTAPSVPSISRTPASPTTSDEGTEVEIYSPPTSRQRIWWAICRTYHVLFPAVHHFRSKTLLGKIAALFAAPAVLVLTLTLPVVVMPYDCCGASEEKLHYRGAAESHLIDFEEEGIERVLIAEEEVMEDMHEMKFNKWLTAAQCAFGPLFCVSVLFSGTKQLNWLLIATAIGGSALGLLVIVLADKGNSPPSQMARCSMGFIVAVVWIMAIADEVVNVLQAFGFIFGLSDAIIGLTVFAVGNSLADLVANTSVAVFAPIMGFSACFGGPMLNILLGVGISGSYIISKTAQPYSLHFTPTLFVSTIGLLLLLVITLVVVPLNAYFLPRKWGIFLIVSYIILMAVNLFVELKH
ncbi:hypothetical protein SERLA73DRAFT_168326 [Serpula lacrymans var. lacrymans S7.3]|uniref:Sodium/calcium exchanger membrane region domain-containing protein n=1 Tax=Serpula lacrymans var. lacrymans (strain S7.3) TaxID=936435 RepID=F8PXU5_SERL3|nr:hypothetical protein SERLA73DRAFT_168326 [Serpula lacrymans var. lacrymans S7.3]